MLFKAILLLLNSLKYSTIQRNIPTAVIKAVDASAPGIMRDGSSISYKCSIIHAINEIEIFVCSYIHYKIDIRTNFFASGAKQNSYGAM